MKLSDLVHFYKPPFRYVRLGDYTGCTSDRIEDADGFVLLEMRPDLFPNSEQHDTAHMIAAALTEQADAMLAATSPTPAATAAVVDEPITATGDQIVRCYGKSVEGHDVMATYSAQAICDMGHDLMLRSCMNSLPRNAIAPDGGEGRLSMTEKEAARKSVALVVSTAAAYFEAVSALFKLRDDGLPLAERQPSKDTECLLAFQALNDTGKRHRAVIDKLREIDAVPDEGEEWQPIDSAPKDGRTLLLGYVNSLGNWRTLRGQWFAQEVIDQEWENGDLCDEGWYETSVECDADISCWATNPTHWMPLPLHPTAPAGEGGERT